MKYALVEGGEGVSKTSEMRFTSIKRLDSETGFTLALACRKNEKS